MSSLLLLVASATFVYGSWLYNKSFWQGKSTPAFAAWAVFSVVTLVNVLTYLQWTAEWVNVAVLLTDCVICIGTTAIVFVRLKGKVRVDKVDQAIVCLSLTAVGIWVVFGTAGVGNWLNQFAYNFAFVPTYRNAIRDPKQEPTRPWAIWTFAFVLNIVALAIKPETQFMDYVAPGVSLVDHVAITLLSLRKTHK